MITAEKLVTLLGLKSHPEGGYYRERTDQTRKSERVRCPNAIRGTERMERQFITC